MKQLNKLLKLFVEGKKYFLQNEKNKLFFLTIKLFLSALYMS